MAKAPITFTFKPSSDTLNYHAVVDTTALRIVNAVAELPLELGNEHILYWWMEGNSGETLSIKVSKGGDDVTTVKESTIPPGKLKAAGYRRLTP
ncbi:MAG: hypothetical protein V4463_24080 [Pseudomonadota bacterium]